MCVVQLKILRFCPERLPKERMGRRQAGRRLPICGESAIQGRLAASVSLSADSSKQKHVAAAQSTTKRPMGFRGCRAQTVSK